MASADELLLSQLAIGAELLGDWYIRPQAREQWEELALDLFPDPKLASIAQLANDGVDPERLETALLRNGNRQLWKFPGDAVEFLLSVPTHARSFASLAHELRDVAGRRKLRRELEILHGKTGGDSTPDLLAALDKAKSELSSLSTDRFEVMTERELLTPPGPTTWICKGLSLAEEEQPVIVFSRAGEGKSWVAFELAVAAATGSNFCGVMPVKRGRVLYLDYEVGAKSTRRRVQTLLKGRGRGALDGNLRPVISPRFALDDPRAEDVLARETDGHLLCTIDSFAAAYGAVDENSAQVGQLLGMLYRVTRRTGCQFLVVHHSRKSRDNGKSDGKSSEGEDLEAMRGSGSIPAQSSAVWSLNGNLAEGARLTNPKNRVAARSDGYVLTLCAAADDPRDPAMGALRLECKPIDRAAEEDESDGFARDRSLDDATERVREFIAQHPETSTRRVATELELKERLVRVALERLVEMGSVRRLKARKGSSSRWVAAAADAVGEAQESLFESPDDPDYPF